MLNLLVKTRLGCRRSASCNLLNGIFKVCFFFAEKRSTVSNGLLGFQHSTWYDTLFNICSTADATLISVLTNKS